MKILVSNPSMSDDTIYLPYLYGILRGVSDIILQDKSSHFEWLSPIFEKTDKVLEPKTIEKLIKSQPDIFLASCYAWNHQCNRQIAEALKENCGTTIIFGGPDIPHRNPQYLEENQYIDHVCVGSAENFIADFISSGMQIVNPNKILYYSNKLKSEHFEFSPYSLYFDIYNEISLKFHQENRGNKLIALLESNRGCPYGCTFCDWGSLTNSKISTKPIGVINQDIEALAKLKVSKIFLADANFGILARDEEIVDLFCDVSQKTGFPKSLFVNMAKSHSERLSTIYGKLIDTGLINYPIQVPMQSYNQDSLKIIKRKNLSKQSVIELRKTFQSKNRELGVTLIHGCPGETPSSWVKTICDAIDNVGYDLRIYDWTQLPNAPSADPEYIKKYQLKTIVRPLLRNNFDTNIKEIEKAEFLVQSFSYSQEDWKKMKVHSAFALCFFTIGLGQHFHGLFRQRNVSSETIFSELFRGFIKLYPQLNSALENHMSQFLLDQAPLKISINEATSVELEEYLTYKLLSDKEKLIKFYTAAGLCIDPGVTLKKEIISSWLRLWPSPQSYSNPMEFFRALGPTYSRGIKSLKKPNNWFELK